MKGDHAGTVIPDRADDTPFLRQEFYLVAQADLELTVFFSWAQSAEITGVHHYTQPDIFLIVKQLFLK